MPPSANSTNTTSSSSTTSPTSPARGRSSVLFELIGARYENRSVLVIANEPFSAWGRIFGSDAMAVAAADRLVHRSHIFELNVESYRRRAAAAARRAAAGETAGKKQGGGPQPV